MNIDAKISNALGITTGHIKEQIIDPKPLIPRPAESYEDADADYKYSREIFYSLVERGQDAIEGILAIAKESEHPRVYEVAGQLIKTVSETTEKLIDLQAKMKELDKDNTMPTRVNNNLFVGSSTELQRLLKQHAQK